MSGIRGIVGNDFTPEYVTMYSGAYGVFSKRKKIVVGRDSRRSGEMLKNAVIAGLLSVGCEVIDLGIVPTPTVLLNVKELKAEGGIAITASHNPSEWNALKLINKNGEFLSEEEGKILDKIIEKDFERVKWSEIKDVFNDEKGVERHIERIFKLKKINFDAIIKRRFKVVIDCVNGASYFAYPHFLRRLGCDVIELFCEDTGDFRRDPEPVPENLKVLENLVKDTGADIGFATDADGDRLSIVSDRGVAIGEEYTITLALEHWFSKINGTSVVNYSTTSMVDYVAKKYKTVVLRAKVGEANVVRRMKEYNAVIGGEGNGGVILPDIQYTRDAMVGMTLILSLLTESKKTITELISQLPKLFMIKETKHFDNLDERDKFYKRLFEKYSKNADLTDGMKIYYKEGWLHLRKSGTEPIIRFICEGENEKWVTKIIKEAMEA